MGVVTYFLLAGYTPFDRDSQQLEMQAIIAGDYKFEPAEYWANVSETAKDFVTILLTLDPAKRPTAAEVLEHKVRACGLGDVVLLPNIHLSPWLSLLVLGVNDDLFCFCFILLGLVRVCDVVWPSFVSFAFDGHVWIIFVLDLGGGTE